MSRLIRPLIVSMVMMILACLLSACGGAPVNPTSIPVTVAPLTPMTVTPFPTLQRGPTRTAFPTTGEILPSTFQVGLAWASAAPDQIGRFKLLKAPGKSYVDTRGAGAVLIYSVEGKGELQASLFLINNTTEPQFSQNDAVDRYNVETGMIKVEKIPVQLGDEAMVSPTNKALGLGNGRNPTVWGELRYRNTVLILYASPELIQNLPDFSKEEAVDLLTKLFNAIPKTIPTPFPTLTPTLAAK